MSITLTDRDTATVTATIMQTTPSGPIYGISGATLADQRSMAARFTNVNGSSGTRRANLVSERALRDPNGKVWRLSINTTIAFENGSPFSGDDVDDLLTSHNSYFSSESDTLGFVSGQARG